MLRKVASLSGHTEDRVWHAAWSNSGKYVASCGEDKVVRIWGSKAEPWEEHSVVCIATLEDAQSRTIRWCDWSHDDSCLACASFDGTIAIWEAQNPLRSSWEMVASLEGHENEVKSVAWSANGKWLASCGRDKTVWIWENAGNHEYECVTILQGKHGHSQDVKSVRWHPHSSLLVSVSYDDTVKVWREDQEDWYCAETLTGHASTVWAAAFDPTGLRLVTVSDDKTIRLWQCQDVKQLCHWSFLGSYEGLHQHVIYSVDWNIYNGYIATGSGDNSLVLCHNSDNNDGLIQYENKFENAHNGDINCVRWNPNVITSDLLVTAGDDGAVNIWRLEL